MTKVILGLLGQFGSFKADLGHFGKDCKVLGQLRLIFEVTLSMLFRYVQAGFGSLGYVQAGLGSIGHFRLIQIDLDQNKENKSFWFESGILAEIRLK